MTPARDPAPLPSALDLRRAVDADLVQLVDALIADYGALLPAGTVIRQVVRARQDVDRAGFGAGLAIAVERVARDRLAALIADAEAEAPTVAAVVAPVAATAAGAP